MENKIAPELLRQKCNDSYTLECELFNHDKNKASKFTLTLVREADRGVMVRGSIDMESVNDSIRREYQILKAECDKIEINNKDKLVEMVIAGIPKIFIDFPHLIHDLSDARLTTDERMWANRVIFHRGC